MIGHDFEIPHKFSVARGAIGPLIFRGDFRFSIRNVFQ